MEMHEICVVGQVTRDIVRVGGAPEKRLFGGAAHYAGVALRSLGLDTAVLTKSAADDAAEVLEPLRKIGITVYSREGGRTTTFRNTYPEGDLDTRTQEVLTIAEPFEPGDLAGISAKALHLGPLTAGEMPVSFLAAAARLGARVSLDVQGFVRATDDGTVRAAPWPEAALGLAHIDVLRADFDEARVLTGLTDPGDAARAIAAMGPPEVVLTDGSAGSLILAGERLYTIPAYPPRRAVDPTGCGDTYMAGYLFARRQSDDIAGAGRFAAALASLKLEHYGASRARAAAARSLLRAGGLRGFSTGRLVETQLPR